MIARHSCRYGVTVTPDNILITSGSQQALDLVGKVFINQGDHLLVERPTYLAAIQAWTTYQAQYTAVSTDEDGMRPDELEAALRAAPKFIYALPNFQNPSGVTLSLERRRALVKLADHYGCPIIEDDPYGQLRYEGEHVPSIVQVDAEYRSGDGKPYTGNVMYMSTFSKTLAPSLRLGWVIAPANVIERLIQAKQCADLNTSAFTQMVAYEVARHGFLDEHVKVIRRVYSERRDAMLAAMAEFFPEGTTWTHPKGGLFLWVRFPEGIDSVDLLKESLKQNVAFLSGGSFFVDRPELNTARFNFSYVDPDRIRDGVKRIAGVLKKMLKGVGV
jgi:2-aminoadipate transaminase